MKNPFTKHPHSIGESYFRHFYEAVFAAIGVILSGVACLIHSIFPFLFVKTLSNTIKKLHARFEDRLSNENSEKLPE